MNILIALIPAIGWGIQPLVIGKIGGKPSNQILGTGIGSLIVGLVVYLFLSPPSITVPVFIISMISGASWVIGQIGQYKSLEIIGVSKTMPLTTGLQLIGTSIISVLFFGEWASVTAKVIGAFAIMLLVIGAIMTSVSEDSSAQKELKHGLLVLLPTSIGYWIYSTLPNLVEASGLALFFPQMLGVFLSALIYVLFTDRSVVTEKKSWKLGIVGLLFSVSALAYIFSAQANGVATAYILTQLNVVVATLGGMFILKEKKTKKEFNLTITGLILVIVGSVITIFI